MTGCGEHPQYNPDCPWCWTANLPSQLTDPPQRCFGRAGNCTEAPSYIWTGPHGGEYLLCGTCCTEWRGEVRGTFVEPERIRSMHTDDRP